VVIRVHSQQNSVGLVDYRNKPDRGIAMDTLLLSRMQFAVTTLFHILFPTLTMGLSVYLVAVESLWLWTKDERYYRMYRFWVKFFSLNFGVGIVTGIVLEFEFGTNFSSFSQRVSNVLSPLLSFEVMTAFFLSRVSGIMLFDGTKCPGRCIFVHLSGDSGNHFVRLLILAANSWMQTPAGYSLVDGTFMITDFTAAL
jgi:cytochrome d ubiquinol oxidase subunit I